MLLGEIALSNEFNKRLSDELLSRLNIDKWKLLVVVLVKLFNQDCDNRIVNNINTQIWTTMSVCYYLKKNRQTATRLILYNRQLQLHRVGSNAGLTPHFALIPDCDALKPGRVYRSFKRIRQMVPVFHPFLGSCQSASKRHFDRFSPSCSVDGRVQHAHRQTTDLWH